ncbi:hypothetical protein GCM10023189_33710 [Nibrella saemangeumensis]|uniref:FAD-binding domain-containing protein n=1 Tax=Nibrella saemangeumensis TaxID=1084526 RepID=A0ABP8N4G9_9BACT
MYDVIVIGGGLAGLVSALELTRSGWSVVLVERKTYPFHKVCGEYVSNEVRPYIESLGVDLNGLGAVNINRFQFSSPSGRLLEATLDLGGFGISRYALDYALYQLALEAGVTFRLGRQAESVTFQEDGFSVALNDTETLHSRLVIGAFGKRSKLDRQMNRAFMQQPSPYIGVKYHIRAGLPDHGMPDHRVSERGMLEHPFPTDVIALHNFPDGYCGMSAIEDDKYCLCYLTTRRNLRQFGNIADMERAILYQNPHLKRVFETYEFLYDKPEVINEISFAPKKAVEDHILMAGDSAGLITPLCGNGMAMAIHGARLVSQVANLFLNGQLSRPQLEAQYQTAWSGLFARRLWVGRNVQRLFGDAWLSEWAVTLIRTFPPLLQTIMRQTHGEVIAATPVSPLPS